MPPRWPALAVAALVAACAHRPAPPDPFSGFPVRSASAAELARAVEADGAAVVSLRGKLALELAEAAGAEPRRCGGALAARNPWGGAPSPGLYVQGTRALLPTLFTLVSDAERFWLHVPSEHVVYTGPVAIAAGAPGGGVPRLDARDLLRALFVVPVTGGEVDREEMAEEYVLSVRRDGRVARRLWIERRRFAVEREVWYGADGREALAIERSRHVEVGGRVVPERLVVRDLHGGGQVRLDFETLAVNAADVDGRAFRPRLPPGVRVVEVAAAEGTP